MDPTLLIHSLGEVTLGYIVRNTFGICGTLVKILLTKFNIYVALKVCNSINVEWKGHFWVKEDSQIKMSQFSNRPQRMIIDNVHWNRWKLQSSTTYLEVFNPIYNVWVYLTIRLRSCCNWIWSCWLLMIQYEMQSSAESCNWEITLSLTSLIYNKNISGPKRVPRGTPA